MQWTGRSDINMHERSDDNKKTGNRNVFLEPLFIMKYARGTKPVILFSQDPMSTNLFLQFLIYS